MEAKSSEPSNTKVFDTCVPRELQRALLKSLFENYRLASDFCWSHFQPPQAKDLSGHYRRGKIEDEWAGIKGRFPFLEVKPRSYRYRTGSYNEIVCGEVVLTQSCLTSPDDIPRDSLHRQTLAKSGQYQLFNSEQPTGASYLYAILTHGVDVRSEKRSRPAFARIEFPNGQCTKYLPGAIDLFARNQDIVSEYISANPAEPAEPQRRSWWKRNTA